MGTEYMSATDWAREHGERFTYTAALDNYDPPRNNVNEIGYFYSTDTVTRAVVLADGSYFQDGREAIYLVDDGAQVAPYYCAAWHPRADYLILHPFPLSRGTRPDNGRPIDMSSWMLGPRRAYHLKVHKLDES